jgi:predicted permease
MNQMLLLLIYSAKSVGIILIAACAGFILIKTNILKKESLQTLSKLVFFLMLPCLLFTKVAKSVNMERIAQFYILPISCVLYIFGGLFLGYIVAKLFKVKKEIFPLPVAASGFGFRIPWHFIYFSLSDWVFSPHVDLGIQSYFQQKTP